MDGLEEESKKLAEIIRKGLSSKKQKDDVEQSLKAILRRDARVPELWWSAVGRESDGSVVLKGGNCMINELNESSLEVCKNSMEPCLKCIGKLFMAGPKYFDTALRLSEFTAKLIMCLFYGSRCKEEYKRLFKDERFEEIHQRWISLVTDTRKQIKHSSISSNSKLPIGALNFVMSSVEIGVYAIPDPEDTQRLLRNVGKLVFDIALSVATMKPSSDLLKSSAAVMTNSFKMVQRRRAADVYHVLSTIEFSKSIMIRNLSQGKPNLAKEAMVLKGLVEMEKYVKKDRRWEVSAAFANLLGGILLGNDHKLFYGLTDTFVLQVINGDAKIEFGGLRALAALGDPPTPEKNLSGNSLFPKKMHDFVEKMGNSLKKEGLTHDLLRSGAEIIFEELYAVAESSKFLKDVHDLSLQVSNTALGSVLFARMTGRLMKCMEATLQAKSDSNSLKEQEISSLKDLGDEIKSLLWKIDEGLDHSSTSVDKMRGKLKPFKSTIVAIKDQLHAAHLILNSMPQLNLKDVKSQLKTSQKEIGFKELKMLCDEVKNCLNCKLQPDVQTLLLGPVSFDSESDLESILPRVKSLFPSIDLLDRFWASCAEYHDILPGKLKLHDQTEFISAESAILSLRKLIDEQKSILRSYLSELSKHENSTKPKAQNFDLNYRTQLKELIIQQCGLMDTERENALIQLKNIIPGGDLGSVDDAGPGGDLDVATCSKKKEGKCTEVNLMTSISTTAGQFKILENFLCAIHEKLESAENFINQTITCMKKVNIKDERAKFANTMELIEADKPSCKTILDNLKASSNSFCGDGLSQKFGPDVESSDMPVFTLLCNTDKEISNLCGEFFALIQLSAILTKKATELMPTDDEKLSDQKPVTLQEMHMAVPRFENATEPDFRSFEDKIDGSIKTARDYSKKLYEQQLGQISEELTNVASGIGQAVGNEKEVFGLESDALSAAADAAVSVLIFGTVKACGPSAKEAWRVRERALFNVLLVSSALKSQHSLEDQQAMPEIDSWDKESKVLNEIGKLCAWRKAFETAPPVKNLFSCSGYIDRFNALIKEGLESDSEKLEKQIKSRTVRIDELLQTLDSEKDADKKQLAHIALRQEQVALFAIMSNVQDISKGFQVMTAFLSQLQSQLVSISSQLDRLTNDVRELRSDVRRLAGLPVHEVLEYHRNKLQRNSVRFPGKVYVPLECEEPEKGKKKKGQNERKELVGQVHGFLKDPAKGLLLISGLAGSGKSVCAKQVEQLVLGKFFQERKKENRKVVLIWANLPELKNPLTDLFQEATKRQYGLRDSQVHELRDSLQASDSEYEAVFVLEAYDELRPQYLLKNLFKTNNLEIYRPQPKLTGAKTDGENKTKLVTNPLYAWPKVIILCRKELLKSVPGYKQSFLPFESLNEDKDEIDEAEEYFQELEIANFTKKNRESYFSRHFSLRARQSFIKSFQVLQLRPCNFANEDQRLFCDFCEHNLAQVAKECKDQFLELIPALFFSLSSPSSDSGWEDSSESRAKLKSINEVIDAFGKLCNISFGPSNSGQQDWSANMDADLVKASLFKLTACFFAATSSFDFDVVRSELNMHMLIFLGDNMKHHKEWTAKDYSSKLKEIAELADLASTPFMVEIIANILPSLQLPSSTPASIKQDLILLTSEEHAEVALALLRKRDLLSENVMAQMQLALKEEDDDDEDDVPGGGKRPVKEKVKEKVKGGGKVRDQGKTPCQGKTVDDFDKIAAAGTSKSDNVKPKGRGKGVVEPRDKKVMRTKDRKQAKPASGTEEDAASTSDAGQSESENNADADGSEDDSDADAGESKSEDDSDADAGVSKSEDDSDADAGVSKSEDDTDSGDPKSEDDDSAPKSEDTDSYEDSDSESDGDDSSWGSGSESDSDYSETSSGSDLDNEPEHVDEKGDQTVEQAVDYILLRSQLEQVAQECVQRLSSKRNVVFLDKDLMEQQLKRAIRRKPLRRALIFQKFVDDLMIKKTDKFRNSVQSESPEHLIREAIEYSGRLACKMTAEGKTQIQYQQKSLIFLKEDEDEWFAFFGVGDPLAEHRRVIREISPVKCSGGIYSFVHKSVQEYLVANAVHDALVDSIQETGVPENELEALIRRACYSISSNMLQLSASVGGAADQPASPIPQISPEGFSGSLRNSRGALSPLTRQSSQADEAGLLSDVQADDRKKINLLFRLVSSLASSVIQTISLDSEEAVRDFLVDMVLGDMKAASALGLVALLCNAQEFHGGKLDHVADNIRALFVCQMPKRAGKSFVHVVAKEGNLEILKIAAEFYADALPLKCNKGRSALAYAIRNGDWDVCEIILDLKSSSSEKNEVIVKAGQLLQDCDSFAIKLKDLFPAGKKKESSEFTMKAAEIGAVSTGKLYFEIKICLDDLLVKDLKNKIKQQPDKHKQMDKDKVLPVEEYRFGGNICVAFVRGRHPKAKSVGDLASETKITQRKLQEYHTALQILTKRVRSYVLSKTKDSKKEDLLALSTANVAVQIEDTGSFESNEEHEILRSLKALKSSLNETIVTNEAKTNIYDGAKVLKFVSELPPNLQSKFLKLVDLHAQKIEESRTAADLKADSQISDDKKTLKDEPLANKKDPKKSKFAPLKFAPLRSIFQNLVKLRLQECPLGNKDSAGTATFPHVFGLSLLITERFGSKDELEIFCKKMTLPSEDIEDDGAFPTHESNLANIFPDRSDPEIKQQSSKTETQPQRFSRSLLVDENNRKETVCMGIAIDLAKEHSEIQCCWSTESKSGEWVAVQSLPREMGTVFPLFGTWNIDTNSFRTFDEPQNVNFGEFEFKNKPPLGFQAYSTAVKGRPAFVVACRQKKWKIARKLINDIPSQNVVELLTWLDGSTGKTLLHTFVSKHNDNAIDELVKMCKESIAGSAGEAEKLKKVLLAPDRRGYCPFSLAEQVSTASRLMETCSHQSSYNQSRSPELHLEMLRQMIRRVFEEASPHFKSIRLSIEGPKQDGKQKKSETRQNYEKIMKKSGCEERLKVFHTMLHSLDTKSQSEMQAYVVELVKMNKNSQILFYEDSSNVSENKESVAYNSEIRLADAVFQATLFQNGDVLEMLPVEKKADEVTIEIAVRSSPDALRYACEDIKANKDFMMRLLRVEGFALKHVAENLKKSSEVVLCAVRSNGLALQFADTLLKGDKELVMEAVTNNGSALQFASADLRNSKDVVCTAIRTFPLSLEHASNTLKSNIDIVRSAVVADGLALVFASKSMQENKSIVAAAVCSDGMALRFASESLCEDKDIVYSAFQSNPMALQYAMNHIRYDTDLLFTLARKNCHVLTAVEYHDDWTLRDILLRFEPNFTPALSIENWISIYENEFSDEDNLETHMRRFYQAAVHFDGMLLEHVPEHLQTDLLLEHLDEKTRKLVSVIYLALDRSDGRALQFASKSNLSDDKIVAFAVEKAGSVISRDPGALAQVWEVIQSRLDEKQINPDVLSRLLHFFKSEGRVVELISSRTMQIVDAAICSWGTALRFIPASSQTEDQVRRAVASNGMALEYAGEKWQNDQTMARLAVGNCGSALQFVGEELRTAPERWKELISTALDQDGCALQFVNDDLKPLFIDSALKQTGLALQFAPVGWKAQIEQYKAIAKSQGRMLKFFPIEYQQDQSIVELAVTQTFSALEYAQVHLDSGTLRNIIGKRTKFDFDTFPGLQTEESETRVTNDINVCTISFNNFSSITCPELTAMRGCRLYYEVQILEISENSVAQFGFADHTFQADDEEGVGVGDDEHSWAVDGLRHYTWHAGLTNLWPMASDGSEDSGSDDEGSENLNLKAKEASSDQGSENSDKKNAESDSDESYSCSDGSNCVDEWRSWSSGDVIGLFCDPAAGRICASVNGVYWQSYPDKKGPREAFLFADNKSHFRGPGLYPALSGSGMKVRYNFGPLAGGGSFRYSPPPGTNMDQWLRRDTDNKTK